MGFRVWSRKSLCRGPMLGYISEQDGLSLVPLAPDVMAISQSACSMFLCNTLIMGPRVFQESLRGYTGKW